MSYLIGIILALAVCISALLIGLSRERAFYPTLLIVIASYYGALHIRMGLNYICEVHHNFGRAT
jgi:flagellar motor component MotA